MESFIQHTTDLDISDQTNLRMVERCLNALEEVPDSIFQLNHENYAFYIGLENLIRLLSQSSSPDPIIWRALSVLQSACKSTKETRLGIVKCFDFLSAISPLLKLELTSEKMSRILMLLKDITHKVHIESQTDYLSCLLSCLKDLTLSHIKQQDLDTTSLCLRIINNLLLNNEAVNFVFWRKIHVKDFLKELLELENAKNMEDFFYEVTKLNVILVVPKVQDNSWITKQYDIKNFVSTTFTKIKEKFLCGDEKELSQVVDFMEDVLNVHLIKKDDVISYEGTKADITDLINAMLGEQSDLKFNCTNEVCRFLKLIWECDISSPLMKVFALDLISICLDCLRKKGNCDGAVKLLSVILRLIKENETRDNYNELSATFCSGLQEVIVPILEEYPEKFSSRMEYIALKTEVLSFLEEAAEIREMQDTIALTPEIIKHQCSFLHEDIKLMDITEIEMNIELLNLLANTVKFKTSLYNFFTEILRNKKCISGLAVALNKGNCSLKQKVLALSSTVGFPISEFAQSLCEISSGEPDFQISSAHFDLPQIASQRRDVDKILKDLNQLETEHKLSDVSSLQLMDFLEVCQRELLQSEKIFTESIAFYTDKIRKLEDRIQKGNLLHIKSTQTCRTLQLRINAERDDKNIAYSGFQNSEQRLQALEKKYNEEKKESNDIIKSQELKIKELNDAISTLQELKLDLQKDLIDKTTLIAKLTAQKTEIENNLMEEKESTTQLKKTVQSLKRDIADLDIKTKHQLKELDQKDKTISNLNEENKELRTVRDHIFQIAKSSK